MSFQFDNSCDQFVSDHFIAPSLPITSKSKMVLGQKIMRDTAHIIYVVLILELHKHLENILQRGRNVLMLHLQHFNSLCRKYQWPLPKRIGLMTSLEDRLQLTVVAGRVAHFYTDKDRFSLAQHTRLYYLIVP
jgi:hypothetical protein